MRNKLIFENQQMSIQKILPRILGFFSRLSETEKSPINNALQPLLWHSQRTSLVSSMELNKMEAVVEVLLFISPENLDAELSEYGVGFQRKSIASSLLGSSSGRWFPEGGLNSCARRFSECDWMAPRKTSTSSGRSPVLEGENQISQRSLSIHLFPTCSQRVQLQGWCFL